MIGLLVLFFVLKIILCSWIIVWIVNIYNDQDCECSKNWRSKFIVFYMVLSILWTLLILALNIYDVSIVVKIMQTNFIAIVIFLMDIVFVIVSLQYINLLKSKSCKCAISNRYGDNILMLLVTIKLIAYFIILISFIIFLILFNKYSKFSKSL